MELSLTPTMIHHQIGFPRNKDVLRILLEVAVMMMSQNDAVFSMLNIILLRLNFFYHNHYPIVSERTEIRGDKRLGASSCGKYHATACLQLPAGATGPHGVGFVTMRQLFKRYYISGNRRKITIFCDVNSLFL